MYMELLHNGRAVVHWTEYQQVCLCYFGWSRPDWHALSACNQYKHRWETSWCSCLPLLQHATHKIIEFILCLSRAYLMIVFVFLILRFVTICIFLEDPILQPTRCNAWDPHWIDEVKFCMGNAWVILCRWLVFC